MSILDKITKQFDSNPGLKVLFFFDSEKEYATELFEAPIPGIHIEMVEHQHFSLKIKLETELSKQKVLLYFPSSRPTEQEKATFILLDILIANKELLLDDVADFMDTYHLLPHQRSTVSRYIDELKLKKNQKVLAKVLTAYDFKEDKVVRGLICSYLDFASVVDPSLILTKLFVLTLPEHAGKLTQVLKKCSHEALQAEILRWVFQYLELSGQSLSKELLFTALRKLKYNALTQQQASVHGIDPYGLLKIGDPVTLQRLNALLIDWQNDPKLGSSMDEVFSTTGKDIRENEIVLAYGFDDTYSIYTRKLIYLVLEGALKLIKAQPGKVQGILQGLSGSSILQTDVETLVRFCGAAANFFERLLSYGSFTLDSPKQYLDSYASEYYRVDAHYRELMTYLEAVGKQSHPDLKHMDELIEEIHTRYEKFLIDLNREWLACLDGQKFKIKSIPVKKQYEFIHDFVQNQDQKVAVIISDALRYEVAQELLKELLADTKGHATIDYVIAGLPSVTSWGMANLLATGPVDFANEALSLSGISTEGTENREKLLQLLDPSAVAVTTKKLASIASRTEIRETYFNQKGIIYLYHDEIDSVGDDRKTELNTFSAVSRAIEYLADLVKKIHSTYNISRVLVTSDHGFLYNQRPLSEATFQKVPQGNHAKSASRYVITKDTMHCSHDYILNLEDCANVKSDLKLVIPKGVNRYRKQGAGSHFVHGGASLQEMVVPVIESTRKRKDISQKVSFKLMNESFTLVSGAIKIKVFQEEPISSSMKTHRILAGIYNSAQALCSNEITHVLDSGSELPTMRTREFILNLSSGAGQESVLTLKIFDEDDADRLNPLNMVKVINNTLIETDF
ncbi:MAG: BREX-1 system phosphatase PglZ type A [Candidatus Marinimicrobia bacterium]|jgi:uncharacterized protein (TIGR02687 family)|nr:BREX-1 system phosphatase PglZ type A [Candidatus Neomarinimicrobiota bacterium]MBT4715155.1 BREX-1 system phosphatase PglZ type A [Candidatus Neomarinimicrobiota bacterium]